MDRTFLRFDHWKWWKKGLDRSKSQIFRFPKVLIHQKRIQISIFLRFCPHPSPFSPSLPNSFLMDHISINIIYDL